MAGGVGGFEAGALFGHLGRGQELAEFGGEAVEVADEACFAAVAGEDVGADGLFAIVVEGGMREESSTKRVLPSSVV